VAPEKPVVAAPAAQPAPAVPSLVGLPLMVVGPVDVGRLIRELGYIDDKILQTKLRKGSTDEPILPKLSQLMEQTVSLNRLNLLKAEDRKRLNDLLLTVRERAPVLHISFSADPAPAFLEKLMAWLRREIHPVVLLTIGLQPNIGAGCIIRSVNKQIDCSLRKDFQTKRDLLMSQLVIPETPAEKPA
jgi:hypothetical protein